jgi:hypothetical protein
VRAVRALRRGAPHRRGILLPPRGVGWKSRGCGGGRGEGGKQPRGGKGRHCCVAAEVPRGGSF